MQQGGEALVRRGLPISVVEPPEGLDWGFIGAIGAATEWVAAGVHP